MRIDIKPLVTEKSVELKKLKKYVMFIPKSTNKIQLKSFLENEYKIKIKSVNILQKPNKIRRRRQIVGSTKSRKKAIITLEKDSAFKQFDNLF